ncbi:hypothetical protein BN946_scf184569.g73 [Trametes cinnabarina]|uniref:RING-type domain-containing protein n=1 Tax=Pycnoporus cinnabarinus TaxID=5643 RepID=A0A060S845_PYCCI|nr:hypothetical protein BN946_scf184569.g73 [Trametes cinnabarina]
MAGITSWYNAQYATWNRIRGIHQQPYLARVDTRASRAATEMATHNNAVILNMGTPAPPATAGDAGNAAATTPSTTQKSNDTLFGPNIGLLGGGPDWTESHEKNQDVLTPEIVKGWIAKSKQTHYSTTTLQALVNLKRPTLRLSPLENDTSEEAEYVESQHHHALEFEFDCDAPKCAIRVHVLLSPKHPMASKADASGFSRLLVFETVVDGGFGRRLKLEDGAMLELGRFANHRTAAAAGNPTPVGSSSPDPEKAATPEPAATENASRRKRFTTFHFRKRNQERGVAGPALAVVDADVHPPAEGEDKSKDDKDDKDDVGVRVTIRLTALDEEGKELPSPNEQVTYLHIVRFGAPSSAVEAHEEEDKRPWVVKVVKREATIGLHTFHLHEIYGLSANSNTPSQTAPAPTATLDTHTYPPAAPPSSTMDDEPSSECLLCLSSPREVILLPCRHLVACRDCALNMIEFGAGGTIVQNDSEITAAPGAEGVAAEGATEVGANAEGTAAANGTPPAETATAQSPPIPTVQANPRRKRKAKGWFCPVCRQPYTSLLRITTTPPEKDEKDEGRDSSSVDGANPLATGPPVTTPAVPPPVVQAERGRFASIPRPAFLRFGRQATAQPDLERGAAPAANAA